MSTNKVSHEAVQMKTKSKMSKMWEQLSEVYPIQLRELKACLGVKELEFIDAPLWWHEKGISYTASGYGEKIPTRRKVKAWGRYYRVYCRIFSNIGTCYIIACGKIFIID